MRKHDMAMGKGHSRRRLLALCLLAAWLGGWGAQAARPAEAEKRYQKARPRYHALMESDEKQAMRHNWMRVIELFEEIARRYPAHPRAADSLYNVGRLYYHLYDKSYLKADLEKAVEVFARLAAEYPDSKLADDALFLAAEIYEGKFGRRDLAIDTYRLVFQRFPRGDMAKAAQNKLREWKVPLTVVPETAKTTRRYSKLAVVEGLKHWSTGSYARLSVRLDRSVSFHKNILPPSSPSPGARRIYLDLKDAKVLSGPIQVKGRAPSLLVGAKAGQFDPQTVRVVIDVERLGSFKIFPLSNPDRLVIDIWKEAKKRAGKEKAAPSPTPKRQARAATTQPSSPPVKTRPSKKRNSPAPKKGAMSLSRQLGLKVGTVVIDPGHGGEDPGAIGQYGLKEKDVVLKVALRLEKKIRERLGAKTVLTRRRDIFVPLEERTAIANLNDADLFISVHVNAAENRALSGIETYSLDFASSPEAARTAALENATSTRRISDLEIILADLLRERHKDNIRDSLHLARYIQKHLMAQARARYPRVKDLGVKHAPFFVLLGAEMPSVLLELSFISNYEDAKLLRSSRYLDTLADAVCDGIIAFVKERQPTFAEAR